LTALGHSSPTVTQQTCAHIFETLERQVADTMNSILDMNQCHLVNVNLIVFLMYN